MVHQLTLSSRLQQIARFLPKGARFADIGSDHAYLPCYVCLHDKTATAIAGEVNQGPYHRAFMTVTSYQLQEQIEVRLGDGLEVIAGDTMKQLVIAGMGGALIQSILENGSDVLKEIERIIVQPNVEAKGVRKCLLAHHYQIVDETITEENGHVYEIIVADKQKEAVPGLSDRELLFGPVLLTNRPQVFVKKWQYECKKLAHVINQMKQATVRNNAKIADFEKKLQWMEEVLRDE